MSEAVIRSLGRKWMIWCYERLPGFAPVTEIAYGLVARNRMVASFFTRLLWGNDVRQPSYFISRRWFLRSLGAVRRQCPAPDARDGPGDRPGLTGGMVGAGQQRDGLDADRRYPEPPRIWGNSCGPRSITTMTISAGSSIGGRCR